MWNGVVTRTLLVLAAVLMAAWLLVGVAACASGGMRGEVYPSGADQLETVDIQVVRDEVWITFTNTTARSLGPGRVWVNRAYSMPIDGLGIGETARLDLRGFVNEFGEGFRAGGFFATETPKALVQVQYAEEGRSGLVGLVVVRGGAG